MMRPTPILVVLVVVALSASTAFARPPVYLDQLCQKIRHLALGGDGQNPDTAGLVARAKWLLPFLPKPQAEIVARCVADLEKGNVSGIDGLLKGIPPWPKVSVQILGAAQQVPGSCHLLRTPSANILVDCGMDQGNDEESEAFNSARFPFDPREIDLLLVTHAHIDHTGLIPRLVKEGFRGKILATPATCELLGVLLEDSARLQERESGEPQGSRKGKKNRQRRDSNAASRQQALYTPADVKATIALLEGVHYDTVWSGMSGVRVRLKDAGHLPGSAAVEVWVANDGKESKIVFGGDTGNWPYPLLRDPQPIEGADLLLLESTYGNRLHETVEFEARYERFKTAIKAAIADGGQVLVPAFAVGRAETVLYWLGRMKCDGSLPDRVPVILDSPMALKTLEIMRRHPECLDETEARKATFRGQGFLDFPGLRQGLARGELAPEGAIVVASSGMLAGGKIMQYVQQSIDRPTTDILFSGFQAPGTLGRELQDGAKQASIYGRKMAVRAKIGTLDGMSGHADQRMLLEWVKKFGSKPGRIVIVHGEPESGKALGDLVRSELSIENSFPTRGELFVLVE